MKRILLTWASSGLGLELGKLFHEKWYEVIALWRTKPSLEIAHVDLDLTSGESIERCVETIREQYSDFECLVHCAGSGKVEKFEEMKFDEADATCKLDSVWPMVLTAKLFDLIKKNEADIMIIWATLWLKGYQYMTAYSVAKWWETGFIENLQIELKWTKSRVMGIYPWGLNTQSNVGEQGREVQMSKITGKEVSTTLMDPKEVAKIICDIYALPKNIELSKVVINKK